MTFAGIVAAQAANVFACRSDRISAFRLGWFSNPLIVLGIVVEVALLLIMTTVRWGTGFWAPLPFRPGSLFRCSWEP